MIELLTGLHPVDVREMIDDTLFEDMKALVCQHHDSEPEPMDENEEGPPPARKCKWPFEELQALAIVAARCSRPQVSLRTTVAEVGPELDQLINHDPDGQQEEQQPPPPAAQPQQQAV